MHSSESVTKFQRRIPSEINGQLLASSGTRFMCNGITASYKSNDINELISLGQELSLAVY